MSSSEPFAEGTLENSKPQPDSPPTRESWLVVGDPSSMISSLSSPYSSIDSSAEACVVCQSSGPSMLSLSLASRSDGEGKSSRGISGSRISSVSLSDSGSSWIVVNDEERLRRSRLPRAEVLSILHGSGVDEAKEGGRETCQESCMERVGNSMESSVLSIGKYPVSVCNPGRMSLLNGESELSEEGSRVALMDLGEDRYGDWSHRRRKGPHLVPKNASALASESKLSSLSERELETSSGLNSSRSRSFKRDSSSSFRISSPSERAASSPISSFSPGLLEVGVGSFYVKITLRPSIRRPI